MEESNWIHSLPGFDSLNHCKQSKHDCIRAIRERQASILNRSFELYIDMFRLNAQYVPDVGILLIRPKTKIKQLPVVLWIHGGGFGGGYFRDPFACLLSTHMQALGKF